MIFYRKPCRFFFFSILYAFSDVGLPVSHLFSFSFSAAYRQTSNFFDCFLSCSFQLPHFSSQVFMGLPLFFFLFVSILYILSPSRCILIICPYYSSSLFSVLLIIGTCTISLIISFGIVSHFIFPVIC